MKAQWLRYMKNAIMYLYFKVDTGYFTWCICIEWVLGALCVLVLFYVVWRSILYRMHIH